MFGCIRKLGCLIILLAAAIAVWFWFAQRPDRNAPATRTVARSVWEPISAAAAERGRSSIDALSRPRGSSHAALTGAEAASYIFLELDNSLPESAQDVEAAVIGDRLAVRAVVNLAELGGSFLGPIARFLSERDTLYLAGTISVLDSEQGQFEVRELRYGDFRAPSGLIPRIVSQIDRGRSREKGVAPHALSLPLPASVEDVRIAGGRITLSKRTQ